MDTDCSREQLELQGFGKGLRRVVANFQGGTLSSDGGAILLAETERQRGIIKRFGECFVDHRNPEAVEHPVADLVAQRVYGLALGYEDLNEDHDELRLDPLLATVVGKQTQRDRHGAVSGTEARRWRARARSTAWREESARIQHKIPTSE